MDDVFKFIHELRQSTIDDVNYIYEFVTELKKDVENGDMGDGLESMCDIATLRQVTTLIKEKYYG